MALRDLFRRNRDGREAEVHQTAQDYAQYQLESSLGRLAYSRKQIAFMTCDDAVREVVDERLQQVADGTRYAYLPQPLMSEAINSAVVVMDVRPRVNARMHRYYDQLIRIKKSTGKFGKDLLCILGPRTATRDYRRGTYGSLYLFVFDPADPDRREPDLPPEGLTDVGGPTLFNFADLPDVLKRWIAEQKG